MLGYGINFVKVVFGSLKRSTFSLKELVNMVFNGNNFLFATFFGMYVGIYRVSSQVLNNIVYTYGSFCFQFISCLLLKKQKKKKSWHMTVAGLFSGISYAIKPNLQMICIAVVTIFQVTITITVDY